MKLGSKVALAGAALVAAAAGVFMWGQPANAGTSTGPAQINFANAPASVAASADITFDVVSAGANPDSYRGFNIGITWTTTGGTVTFNSATNTGTVINSPFCPAPATDAGPPQEVIFACTTLGAATTVSGKLADFVFDTTGTGCVTFHLKTRLAPDNGGNAEGTYLISAGPTPPANQPQTNALGSDIQVAIGSPTACQQGGGGTPTAPSGGQTTTPTTIVRSATPTPDDTTPAATSTAAPGESPTTAPPPPGAASPTPGGGTGPGGVQPPDTGTGGGSSDSGTTFVWIAVLGFAGLAVTGGAVAVRKARASR
jgi:hypothetical protein